MKSEMGSNSRGGLHPSRHASRTPPFLMVGLLVVIAVLTFNYWTTSVANQELEEKLARVNKHFSELNKRYSELNQRFLQQNSQLFSKNQEFLTNKDQLFQTEKREKEFEKEANICHSKNTELSQNLGQVNSEFEANAAKLNEAENELRECKNSVDECNQLKRNAENAAAQCRQNEVALETKVQQFQQQLQNANNAAQSFNCNEQVARSRVSLLDTLQNFGGPQVLLSLQKVGVDISGVELKSDWKPPQTNRFVAAGDNSAPAVNVQNVQPAYNVESNNNNNNLINQALPSQTNLAQQQGFQNAQLNNLPQQQQPNDVVNVAQQQPEQPVAVEESRAEDPRSAQKNEAERDAQEHAEEDGIIAEDPRSDILDEAVPLEGVDLEGERGELEAAAAAVGEELPQVAEPLAYNEQVVASDVVEQEEGAGGAMEPPHAEGDQFDPDAQADDDEDLIAEEDLDAVEDEDTDLRAMDDDLEGDEADEGDEPLDDDAQYDEDRDPANAGDIDEGEDGDDELLDDDVDGDDPDADADADDDFARVDNDQEAANQF